MYKYNFRRWRKRGESGCRAPCELVARLKRLNLDYVFIVDIPEPRLLLPRRAPAPFPMRNQIKGTVERLKVSWVRVVGV